MRHGSASNIREKCPAAGYAGTYSRKSAGASANKWPNKRDTYTGAPSTNLAKGDTSAPRVIDQTEEQQLEVAQSTFADATARGKAIVIIETANSGPAPLPKEEAEEDEVEEVLGRPQDKRQHVYVSRWWNNQWVVHEEIPEVEETMKVE